MTKEENLYNKTKWWLLYGEDKTIERVEEIKRTFKDIILPIFKSKGCEDMCNELLTLCEKALQDLQDNVYYTYDLFIEEDWEHYELKFTKKFLVNKLKEHLLNDNNAYDNEGWEVLGDKEWCLNNMNDIIDILDNEVLDYYIELLNLNSMEYYKGE